MEIKNVVGYVRVSTEAQGEEDRFGIPAQIEIIENYCKSKGYNIVDIFIDKISGAKENRPQWLEMISEYNIGRYDAVVTAKTDRVARDVTKYFAFKYQLNSRDKELISAQYDFGAYGNLAPMMESLIASIAEVERIFINERTGGGRAQKAKNGGYAGGRVPFGYVVKDKQYAIEQHNAEAVRLIFKMWRSGSRMQPILDELERLGYRNKKGNPYYKSFINTIINNEPTYYGYYHYGDAGWVIGRHEPILKDISQMSERCRELIKDIK